MSDVTSCVFDHPVCIPTHLRISSRHRIHSLKMRVDKSAQSRIPVAGQTAMRFDPRNEGRLFSPGAVIMAIQKGITLVFAGGVSAGTVTAVIHNMQQAIDLGNRLFMMDAGEVILDINSQEKQDLTVEKLVTMFSSVRNKKFTNDEALLSR